MKTGNSIRKVLIRRDIPGIDINQIENNHNEKENLYSSKRINNQVHYASNAENKNSNNINKIKEMSKKLILKDIEEDEEIDHPKPIISESEEELNDIKNNFINKIENKRNSNMNLQKRKNEYLNLKYFPKSSELIDYTNLLPEGKKQYIEKNNKKPNLINKNGNKIICIKKNNISGASANKKFNPFKSKIINNNDIIHNYNTEVKIKENNDKFKGKNEPKQLFNYQNTQIINEQELFKNLKEKKDKKMNDNGLGKEYFNNNLNKSQQFGSKKNSNNNHSLYFNSTYIPINKLKYKAEPIKRPMEEECEKNNSQESFMQTMPNTKNKRIRNISNYKNIRIINSTDVDKIKKKAPKVKIQPIYLQKKNNFNKSDIIQIPKIRKVSDNILNISKLNSSEMKIPSLPERHSSLEKKKENERNYPKYSKNTFDKGRNYNNVQTTYVVISKKKNSKDISKADIPESKNNNNNNNILMKSANFINSSKLNCDTNTSKGYFLQLKYQRNNLKDSKENKTNYSLSNNNHNYGTNIRKFIKSSINESNGIYFENKKNTNHLVNKSVNINKNMPIIDCNYDYYYDAKQIGKNSYIPLKPNYNY